MFIWISFQLVSIVILTLLCHLNVFGRWKLDWMQQAKSLKKKNFYKPNLISTFLFFVSFFKFSWYEIIKLIFNIRLFRTGLQPYLFLQPIAYHTPDAGKQGVIDLPEFPFALEPRIMTRWDKRFNEGKFEANFLNSRHEIFIPCKHKKQHLLSKTKTWSLGSRTSWFFFKKSHLNVQHFVLVQNTLHIYFYTLWQ